MNSEDPNT
jgi:WD repeat-containing protein 45